MHGREKNVNNRVDPMGVFIEIDEQDQNEHTGLQVFYFIAKINHIQSRTGTNHTNYLAVNRTITLSISIPKK